MNHHADNDDLDMVIEVWAEVPADWNSRMTDHAAAPCDDCREPLDADACRHNVDRPYCSACIGNCAECVADLRDDVAAEAAEEWRLQ